MRSSDIIKKVSEYYRIAYIIENTSRQDPHREARAMCYILLRDMLELSYQQIGDIFNKEHATILSAYKRFKGWMQTDKQLFSRYLELCSLFNTNAVSESIRNTHDIKLAKAKKLGINTFIFDHPEGWFLSDCGICSKINLL